jgi:NTP pyrophosphatase (non-canonical NTP hydrolase)
MKIRDQKLTEALNSLSRICHKASREAGWWDNPIDGFVANGEDVFGTPVRDEEWRDLVTPTKIALIHSEVSEAMEGFRKDINDDHLPERKMAEVELADALIRIFDLAGAHDMDLGGALVEKFNYNQERADHKPENRAADGGKKF